MNLVKILLLIFLLVVGKLVLDNTLNKEGFRPIGSIGKIMEQIPYVDSFIAGKPSKEFVQDLNQDLLKFQDSEQDGSGGKKVCYELLPGSPGANQYNYGWSVDCDCKGVPGDLVSGKCGKITTFNENELALRDNYSKSTPEVINLRTENWIPPHMISQLHYVGPFQKNVVEAANQNVAESTCFFTSEKTNLEQYFKANPDLYLDTDKYSTFKPYVPFANAWEEASDCSNNISYYTDKSAPGHFIVNKVQ